ncbi:hypothetical protein V5O48_007868 [Marasmius crinis-equi]|uniref:Uncharacterized protein n=1 Tax=Marasmius crinis-equi TaxID=585013 RepID=A0ABR3FFM2_9AGAR
MDQRVVLQQDNVLVGKAALAFPSGHLFLTQYSAWQIRYYTLGLLFFNVVQIHTFAIPGVTSDNLCVAMDSIIRVVGAVSLWSVEIVMQLRIYALYKCDKRILAFNGFLFLASIAGFLWILIHNAQRRRAVIADAVHLPLPGCPSLHSGIEWAQWIPATGFEGVLFGLALYKTLKSSAVRLRDGRKVGLYGLLLRDNLFYFFAIALILVFNNLMVVGITKIPWFSYSPFYAAVGILTTRMMLNMYKAASTEVTGVTNRPGWPTRSAHGREPKTEASLSWHAAGRGVNSSGFASSNFNSSVPDSYELNDKKDIVP